jgi:CheY-like chemotaxis protein
MDENHQHQRPGTFRIAVADDDEACRTTFVRLIQAMGHRVVCVVGNGRELVDRCNLDDIDLILADFDMPDMDGLELAEHLSQTGVPIVLVSGHAEADDIVLDNEPVARLLRKPVSLRKLAEVIQKVAAKRST